jgi:superfamily II DNA/RNA helicase
LKQLTGLDFEIVSDSGAPQSERTFVLWNPQGSPYTDAVTLLTLCLEVGWKTIVFTKARKITELISMWIHQARPEWADRIRSYRAGYLPEERREIEEQLFSDKLQAVIATSALEVGIDVGGLDACIMVGYPGTVISTWQRAGRVGRAEAPSRVLPGGHAGCARPILDEAPQKVIHPQTRIAHGGGRERSHRRGAPLLRGRRTAARPREGQRILRRRGWTFLIKHLAVKNDTPWRARKRPNGSA